MSSASINASSRLAGTECCRPSKGKRSGISVIAGPHGWAATCTSATGVDIASSYITPAATGTAPSARPELALDGWRNAKPSFCLFPISTSYSLCRSRSAAWHCKTPSRFTPSYSALPPPRCWKPLPIPGCLAPPSASLRCCTPGGRTCTCTLTCTASYRAEALPRMARAGLPAARSLSSSPCACSAAASARSSCALSSAPSVKARCISTESWRPYLSRPPCRSLRKGRSPRLGGARQTSPLAGLAAPAQVSSSLHPSCSHFQSPAALSRKRPRPF